MRRLLLAAALTTSLVSVAQAVQPRWRPALPSQQALAAEQETLPAPQPVTPSEPAPPRMLPQQTAPQNGPQPQQPGVATGLGGHRHVFLQRYKYSSYGTWVKTMGPGYPAYRYTYSGQKDNFPLPAIFQSGSEHTNYTGGPGF